MNLSTRLKLLLARRQVYRAVFLDAQGQPNAAAQAVLADLARFARAHKSTAVVSPVTRTVDTHATMLAEGRREVFNRIVQYLNLSESQIYSLMERDHDHA